MASFTSAVDLHAIIGGARAEVFEHNSDSTGKKNNDIEFEKATVILEEISLVNKSYEYRMFLMSKFIVIDVSSVDRYRVNRTTGRRLGVHYFVL